MVDDQTLAIRSKEVVTTIVVEVPRTLRMHRLTTQELDDFASSNVGIHFGFFGLALGGFISFGITLLAGQIQSPKIYASFVALAAVSFILAGFFGARAVVEYRRVKRKVQDIKTSP